MKSIKVLVLLMSILLIQNQTLCFAEETDSATGFMALMKKNNEAKSETKEAVSPEAEDKTIEKATALKPQKKKPKPELEASKKSHNEKAHVIKSVSNIPSEIPVAEEALEPLVHLAIMALNPYPLKLKITA